VEWQKRHHRSAGVHALAEDRPLPRRGLHLHAEGDVFAFPRGATPLDFAYRIHTDVGHHCVGARVNGKLVPLRTPLRNGDILEILTAPNQTPSRSG